MCLNISFAVLLIPHLSVIKGYFQGHKYIGPSSTSKLIEQVMEFDFDKLIKEVIITDSSMSLKTNLEDLIGLKDDILLTLKEH